MPRVAGLGYAEAGCETVLRMRAVPGAVRRYGVAFDFIARNCGRADAVVL
jgi:hypothetical protein